MSNVPTLAKLIPLCVILGAGSVTVALADSPAATAAVAKIDKDNDKTLDLNEVKAAAEARFAALEKDNDGTLDPKEAKGVIGEPIFKSADPDHDGTIDKTEYLNLVEKVFKQADTDHDGTLDAKELSSKAGVRLRRLLG